ncbi:unnamed protein product [Sphagnum troendelagicum]|uniref:Mitochondrial carrier protein n=1 Tax=Sphagnum troendelagicum TaxID=128251 RepID=A0ABP0U790_9BRYO
MALNKYKLEDYRNALVARQGLAAAAAIASEAAVSYPLDTVKALVQVSANAGKNGVANGGKVWEMAVLVMRVGVPGAYGGAGWQLLGRLPVLGARFGVYQLSSAFVTDGRGSNDMTVSEASLAGLFTGCVESLVATPFDFLKTRRQLTAVTYSLDPLYTPKANWAQVMESLAGLPATHPNMISSLQKYPWLANGTGHPPIVRDMVGIRQIIDVEGWKVLWRGFRPGLFRDATYAGFFFGSWEFLCEFLLEHKAYYMDEPPSSLEDIDPLTPWQLSVTAGLAASVAAVASHPMDTAKTRSQATVLPKHVAMERKLLKWVTRPGNFLQRTLGIIPFDQPLLLKGLGIRTAQHGLAMAALVGTYHTVLQYLLH